nr:nadh-ubiquinone oxidoreductase 29.9 kda subunit, mitochondrial [Quercus suber]
MVNAIHQQENTPAIEPEPPLTADQINDIEARIGAGLIEEVIQVAEGERDLAEKLAQSKVSVLQQSLVDRQRTLTSCADGRILRRSQHLVNGSMLSETRTRPKHKLHSKIEDPVFETREFRSRELYICITTSPRILDFVANVGKALSGKCNTTRIS